MAATKHLSSLCGATIVKQEPEVDPADHHSSVCMVTSIKQELVEADPLVSAYQEDNYIDFKEETPFRECPSSEDFLISSTFSVVKAENGEDWEEARNEDKKAALAEERQAEIPTGQSVARTHWKRTFRERFVTMIEEEGCSIRSAGTRCGVPHSTANRWWKNYLERGTTNRAAGSGRKRLSSQREDRELVSKSRENPFLDAKQLRRETNFPGSSDTIRRRLREAGLHTRRST